MMLKYGINAKQLSEKKEKDNYHGPDRGSIFYVIMYVEHTVLPRMAEWHK